MSQSRAKTVAEYVASLPPDRQRVVKQTRSFVKKHLPKGYKEEIGWGAITYSVQLSVLPDTYNGQPLCYAALAAQKNSYTLYLMGVYGNPAQKTWLAREFKKRGKRFDMGKSCLHFKSLDDLPLDVVGEVIASTPMDKYIEIYKASRANGAKGAKGAKGASAKGAKGAQGAGAKGA
jgi:hypothetical protein